MEYKPSLAPTPLRDAEAMSKMRKEIEEQCVKIVDALQEDVSRLETKSAEIAKRGMGEGVLLDIMRFEIFTQLFTQHMHTCNRIHSLRQPMF